MTAAHDGGLWRFAEREVLPPVNGSCPWPSSHRSVGCVRACCSSAGLHAAFLASCFIAGGTRRRTTHGHFSSYLSQFTTWLLCADSGCGSASNWWWRAAPSCVQNENHCDALPSLARFLARVALYSRAVLREYSLAAGLPAGKRRYLDYSKRSEVHSCSGKTVDRFRTTFRGAKMVRTSHITPCRVWWGLDFARHLRGAKKFDVFVCLSVTLLNGTTSPLRRLNTETFWQLEGRRFVVVHPYSTLCS